MDYISKLFCQYPFLYEVGSDYYAFGTGICKKCNDFNAIRAYEKYKECLKSDDKVSIRKSFKKVILNCQYLIQLQGIDINPISEFQKIKFEDGVLDSLALQVKEYINIFQIYEIRDFM